MYALPPTLIALVASMLASTGNAASLRRRQSDGSATASAYTDASTNITFLGYAPANTGGFKFGMALPSSPASDLIVQLVSPLNANGGGWGAIDFGAQMEGFLMIAAWPDTTSKPETVKVSPRIATGYEVSNGANVYTTSNITITPIPSGTFVNTTHVAATFVCGGCINADSFKSGVSKGSASFSYAYALTAVSDPADEDTLLSDHTLQGELYGPFDVTLKDAESGDYASWVELTSTATATAGATGTASASAAPVATAGSGSGSSSSSSSSSGTSSSSSSSSSSSDVDVEEETGLGTGPIVALVGLGFVYVLQALQIL